MLEFCVIGTAEDVCTSTAKIVQLALSRFEINYSQLKLTKDYRWSLQWTAAEGYNELQAIQIGCHWYCWRWWYQHHKDGWIGTIEIWNEWQPTNYTWSLQLRFTMNCTVVQAVGIWCHWYIFVGTMTQSWIGTIDIWNELDLMKCSWSLQ